MSRRWVQPNTLLVLGGLGLFGVVPPGCGWIGVEVLDRNGQPVDATPGEGVLDADVPPLPGLDAGGEDAASPQADAGASDAGAPDLDATTQPDAASVDDAAVADASTQPDAGTGVTDASTAVDSGTGQDAQADAALDAGSDAGALPAGARIVIDNNVSSALTSFPVRVSLDTRSMIQQGALAADCSDLRIFGGDACGEPRAFFLPDHACDSAASELWVLLPQLAASGRETLAIVPGGAGLASDGSQVFLFFDDFVGSALDTGSWVERGVGSLSVGGGVLTSDGIKSIESVPSVVSAGTSIAGARLRVIGRSESDVEFGAGAVDTSEGYLAWAFERAWDGATFLSYTDSIATFNGPTGSSCDDLQTRVPSPVGEAWADTDEPASFQIVEFSYANLGGTAQTQLDTSRGVSLSFTAPDGCTLPSTLPIFISLDHDTDANSPTQTIDYVYVRPSAPSEPIASVLLNSSVTCGSEP